MTLLFRCLGKIKLMIHKLVLNLRFNLAFVLNHGFWEEREGKERLEIDKCWIGCSRYNQVDPVA